MNIVKQNPQNFNHQGATSPNILSTLDLIEYGIEYCREQAVHLAQLALWYNERAQVLEVERRALADDVDAVLAEAEGVLA